MGRREIVIDPYDKKRSDKSQALDIALRLGTEARRVTRKEDLFPKRARWQGAYQIMDLALKVQMAVAYANGIRVETHGLMVERYNAQSMAWSWVYTMDAIVSAMQHDLEADADKLETLAGLLNQARKTIRAWQQADLKRYEPQFGSLTAAELGEPSTVKLRWF